MNPETFGDAKWIWNFCSWGVHNADSRIQFRRTFDLKEVPLKAEVVVTADARYTLWVNGEYVNHGPARGYQSHWPVDRVDLAPYLRTGRNVIAALGYQFGAPNYVYFYQGDAGFLLAGHAGEVDLKTGGDWKYRTAPGYICAVAKGSSQYLFQEFFDCRTGDDGWREVEYDDSAWADTTGRTPGCQPWPVFEERGIPLLSGEIRVPEKELPPLRFVPVANWRETVNVGRLHQKERQYNPQGEGTERVFDFGSEFAGFIRFECDCDTDGTVLDFLVSDDAENGIPVLSTEPVYTTTLHGGRLILRKGRNSHQLSLPWGGRFISLIQRDKAEINVRISVQEAIYPLEETGTFESNNTLDNEIRAMCVRTQRHCMCDAYVDGPWRENAQWWGDALVEAGNTFVLADDPRLLERGLRQVASTQIDNGLTYGVTPGCGHRCILPDYSAFYLATLHLYWYHTGFTELYGELRETAKKIAGYFDAQSEKDGLLHHDPRYWLFLDWCPELPKEGVPTLYNMIALYGLRKLHEVALAANDAETAILSARIAGRIEKALCEKAYDRKNHAWFNSLNDSLVPVPFPMSAHVAAFGILLELFPEEQSSWMDDTILPLLKENRRTEWMPSPYFIHYVFEAAKQMGHGREVLDCIRRWWSDFLNAGLKTTAEHWPESLAPPHSRCHAWSAHPLIHYRDLLLGIRPAATGWEKITFEPVFTPGEKASGTVPTPRGMIRVSWDFTSGRTEPKCALELPPGVTQAK
ncbi:MAG: Bacterial alpha-L-rhamnosidase [Lentisphaerae bacterium ADurb.Bin242]|nr:MAG: Bacterial alpha-L-rhamnosidase [Lentisphaerae bacterium ADurb.Bin242]